MTLYEAPGSVATRLVSLRYLAFAGELSRGGEACKKGEDGTHLDLAVPASLKSLASLVTEQFCLPSQLHYGRHCMKLARRSTLVPTWLIHYAHLVIR